MSNGEELVDYVMQYGGNCRDCADQNGTCPHTGLPCEVVDARMAVRHVLAAVEYGRKHGYLAPSPSAVEAAEVVPVATAWILQDYLDAVLADTGPQPVVLWRGEPPNLNSYVPLFASPPPASPSAPQGVEVGPVIAQITALLELDATGKLVPHGIGGLARELLTTCRGILSAIQTSPEAGR